jgi:hypothetical protein
LRSYFGANAVARGNKAFDVRETSYHVEADVSPFFEHRVVKRELEDLMYLADKYPKVFYELVESTKSRFLKWAADPRCARILGNKSSLNPLRCMNERSIVLVDLSGLSMFNNIATSCAAFVLGVFSRWLWLG